MGELLVDEPADGVVRLTISNPAKRNALDHPILDAITATLAELSGDAATDGESDPTHPRCVIVTGSDGMFSAGYDIGEIPDEEFEERAEALVAHPFTEAIEALEAFPYPTLAALPGHTIGGGLELALACDLRVAACGDQARDAPRQAGSRLFAHRPASLHRRDRRGAHARAVPAWALHPRRRRAAVGTRQSVVPAEQLDAATLDLAAELAGNAPLSQTGNKRVIAALLDARDGLSADVEAELIELRRASFASQDMREGMKAFAEKRPARWRGV